jgi:hypothetical protein
MTAHVYYAGVRLNPAKTVQYVVLPHLTDSGQVAQITALHMFAIGFSGYLPTRSGPVTRRG